MIILKLRAYQYTGKSKKAKDALNFKISISGPIVRMDLNIFIKIPVSNKYKEDNNKKDKQPRSTETQLFIYFLIFVDLA